MSGIRFQDPNPQFFDDDGDVLAGGSLTFYVTGTSTPATTYDDDDLDPGDANPNPIDLDADGRPSVDIFLDPAVVYRCVLKDANDATIWDKDPIAGGDINAAITAHNNDLSAHYAATESQRGFVELASQSEVNTGTDTARAVTPAGLANRTATETRAGVVELATTVEAAAGADTTRAVTPAGLAAFQTAAFASAAETLTGTSTTKAVTPGGFAGNKSLAASGYYKFPGGFIVQWGSEISSTDSEETFTFPTAFATACYGVIVQRRTQGADEEALFPLATEDPTTTQFKINRSDDIGGTSPFYYLAWGV